MVEEEAKVAAAPEMEPLPLLTFPKRREKKEESESNHDASRPAATVGHTKGPQVQETKAMIGTVTLQHIPRASTHPHAGKGVDPHPLPLPAYLRKGGGGKNQSPTNPVGAIGQHQRTDGLVLVLPGPAGPHRGPEAHGDRLPHPDCPGLNTRQERWRQSSRQTLIPRLGRERSASRRNDLPTLWAVGERHGPSSR